MLRSQRQKNSAKREALLVLRQQLRVTQGAIDCARMNFDQATDPTMVDCYIYEWNAASLRYQFLLKCIREMEAPGMDSTVPQQPFDKRGMPSEAHIL